MQSTLSLNYDSKKVEIIKFQRLDMRLRI